MAQLQYHTQLDDPQEVTEPEYLLLQRRWSDLTLRVITEGQLGQQYWTPRQRTGCERSDTVILDHSAYQLNPNGNSQNYYPTYCRPVTQIYNMV